MAAWFRRWAQLETTAITPYTYECRLIPGLLQTEAYARTLFTGGVEVTRELIDHVLEIGQLRDVEVATCPHTIHVRDSKAPQERQLALSTDAWAAFVSHCRKG